MIEAGQSSPLEESFCQRVIDGCLPRLVQDVAALPTFTELPPTDFPMGAHMSTPIVLNDGRVYGTLCCFSFAPNEQLAQRDLKKLEMSAQLTAKKIDERRARDAEKATGDGSLQRQEGSGR